MTTNIGQGSKYVDMEVMVQKKDVDLKVVATLVYEDKVLDKFEESFNVPLNLEKLPSVTQEPKPTETPIGMPFTDIQGTPFEREIVDFYKLGFVKGYEDKTFKPYSNISRAEFATLVSYMIGKDKEAQQLQDKEIFPDIKKNYWANGFINVVRESQLVKGFPDGTFKPYNNVTNSEVITVCILQLEGTAMLDAKKEWPDNFISRAQDLGLLDELDVSNRNPAIRGNVVKLLWRVQRKQL